MVEGGDADLQALLDGARADEAVQARIRERWLRQQAGEDATFARLLGDLARRSLPMSLHTTAGWVHQGTVGAVGADFCTVRTAAGSMVHVRLAAVGMVRPQTGVRHDLAPPAGEGEAGAEQTLVHVLARAAEDRPRVHVVVGASEVISGELERVGSDVATLRLDDGQHAHLALAAVSEVGFSR
jgi:hypothetical protein